MALQDSSLLSHTVNNSGQRRQQQFPTAARTAAASSPVLLESPLARLSLAPFLKTYKYGPYLSLSILPLLWLSFLWDLLSLFPLTLTDAIKMRNRALKRCRRGEERDRERLPRPSPFFLLRYLPAARSCRAVCCSLFLMFHSSYFFILIYCSHLTSLQKEIGRKQLPFSVTPSGFRAFPASRTILSLSIPHYYFVSAEIIMIERVLWQGNWLWLEKLLHSLSPLSDSWGSPPPPRIQRSDGTRSRAACLLIKGRQWGQRSSTELALIRVIEGPKNWKYTFIYNWKVIKTLLIHGYDSD